MIAATATGAATARGDIEVVTFGCRLNAVESDAIRDRATEAGLTDAVVVNTCAVTAEAERQAAQEIRRLSRERPDARIFVTGCAAQIAPAKWAAMPEVDRVLGNAEKLTVDGYAGGARVRVGDIMAAPADGGGVATLSGRSRAFLQIQTGCDHRCTFCVIPFGRGPSRSAPAGELVRMARRAVAAGYREIVLTGVDLTAYGADLPGRPTLGETCRRLLRLVPELPRLRLSSLDPVEVDDTLIALLGDEPRLMPHLHLSAQAGDDMVLKRMRRRHSRDDILRLVERVRRVRPDVAFGADLIAGFPTETDAMFDGTLGLVGEADLTWLHVFPYSARDGTPAARMPQVPGDVRRERAARLRAAGARRAEAFLRGRIGTRARVVMERDGTGRSEHFARVRPASPPPPRALVDIDIEGLADGALTGRPVERIAA